MPITKEVDLSELAKKTLGYTGADLESFVREAAMLALRESMNAKEVRREHFMKALEKVKPSVSESTIEVYKKVEEQYLKSAKTTVPVGKSYFG